MSLPPLDPLLHQPVRTQLVAYLSGRGESSFSELKRVLGITDGNLGAHLAKLVEAGYLSSGEIADGGRIQTVYRMTPSGRTALTEYVDRITRLMVMSAGNELTTTKAHAPGAA